MSDVVILWMWPIRPSHGGPKLQALGRAPPRASPEDRFVHMEFFRITRTSPLARG
jgi:hypothetical protein